MCAQGTLLNSGVTKCSKLNAHMAPRSCRFLGTMTIILVFLYKLPRLAALGARILVKMFLVPASSLPQAANSETAPGQRRPITFAGASAGCLLNGLSGSWAVLAQVGRARGARGPLTLRLAGTPERWIERKDKQPTGYPMYWWVPTDRPNLRLGSRKGAYCPKWEV